MGHREAIFLQSCLAVKDIYYISFHSYCNKLPRIGYLKRNVFSHSCAGEKAEIKVLEGHAPSEALGKNQAFLLSS